MRSVNGRLSADRPQEVVEHHPLVMSPDLPLGRGEQVSVGEARREFQEGINNCVVVAEKAQVQLLIRFSLLRLSPIRGDLPSWLRGRSVIVPASLIPPTKAGPVFNLMPVQRCELMAGPRP